MPDQIGPYEIIEELGRGGMGRVYAARQVELGRIVALKVIGESWNNTPDLELRFLREAQTVARLRHPHIVAVHDSARADGLVYFSMDFIDGGDLATRLKDRVYTPRESAALLEKIAGALVYAHGEGVLHRDLKPSNILLEGEEPRLADFGLAAQLDAGGDLTAISGILGTPHYLAPEAVRGGSAALSVASDLYALGVILFEMLTGRTPFAGASPAELGTLVANNEPPSPRLLAPPVPRDLETICLKCLERDSARRYHNAAALAEDLRRFLADEPIIARPVSPIGRFTRWCRRKPAFAAVWFLVTAIAVGSTAAMIRIHREQVRAESALAQTRIAETGARERLRDAKLAEARAIRRTNIPGRRQQALGALTEAARIRAGADLRDEALAAFLLYDVKALEKWSLDLGGAAEITLDPKGTVAAVEKRNIIDAARDPARLRRWGAEKEFATLSVPGTRAIGAMHFSNDGKLVMARYLDETLRVWRVGETEPFLTIPHRPLPDAERRTETFNADYDFTPDGSLIALGLPGKGVSLHRTADGAEIARWEGGDLFHTVNISPDGRFLAADSLDRDKNGGVYVLNIPSLTLAYVLKPPSTPGALAWSSDSRVLGVGQRESSFAAYDVRDGRLLANTSASVHDASEIHFLGGDTLLAARGAGNSLHILNAALGREELSFNSVGPSQLAIEPAGASFIMPSVDTSVTRMGVETPLGFRIIPPPRTEGYEVSGNCFAVDFSADGRWIASSNRAFLLLFDAATGRLVCDTDAHVLDSTDASSVVFSADGTALYRCSTASTFVKFPILAKPGGGWAFGPGESLGSETGFFIADQSADRQCLVLLNFATGEVKIVVVADGKLKTLSHWISPGVYSAALSPDATQLLTNGTNMGPDRATQRIRIYRVSDGAVLKELPGRVSCDAVWSSDGHTAMTSNGPAETTLWDPADWHVKASLKGELGGDITTFAISPGGSYAVVTHDDRIHLVSTRDGSLLATFESPAATGLAASVRFLPDRKRFAILWREGRIDIVDPEAMQAGLATIGLGW
jgi:WD40 repeat protein